MHGKQILDGLLIANECIHSRHKDKLSGLICKVDLKKAYDKVDWNFLSYLKRRMGFGAKGSRWILECVSTAHRGLRQGDPLSPFLFAIVGDALSRMISAATEANLISGFRPTRAAPRVSHLQFDDDTLLFYAAEEDQVKNAIAILRCYEAVSGLKVNLFKSALVGISVRPSLVTHLAKIMGCKVGSLPTSS